jgi:hypothetical protein
MKFQGEFKMRMHRVMLAAALSVVASSAGFAQEKGKSESGEKATEMKKPITPLRVQVVFNEFEGDKRISSLPYTILVNADTGGPIASIRMGLRVPIRMNPNQVSYQDMGTNIDGRAERTDDGKFLVGLSVERTSAYKQQTKSTDEKNDGAETQPVIQQFRSQLNLLIRDGQTLETTVSTDPISGRVTKVEVTLNVVK